MIKFFGHSAMVLMHHTEANCCSSKGLHSVWIVEAPYSYQSLKKKTLPQKTIHRLTSKSNASATQESKIQSDPEVKLTFIFNRFQPKKKVKIVSRIRKQHSFMLPSLVSVGAIAQQSFLLSFHIPYTYG